MRHTNWLRICNSRLVAIVACATLAGGCHAGVDSPVAPSAIGASVPQASDASVATSSDAIFSVRAAPVSYAMDEINSSGYSGTCTIASTHAGGFRVKAEGQGPDPAGTMIRFNLVNVSTPELYRTTAVAALNQQGTFRTGWDVWGSTTFSPGTSLECWLTVIDDSTAILATSKTVQAF